MLLEKTYAKRSFQHEWTLNITQPHTAFYPTKSSCLQPNYPPSHENPHIIITLSQDLMITVSTSSHPSNSQMKKNNIRPFNPKVAARPSSREAVKREVQIRRMVCFPIMKHMPYKPAIKQKQCFSNTKYCAKNAKNVCKLLKCYLLLFLWSVKQFYRWRKEIWHVWKKQPHASITWV